MRRYPQHYFQHSGVREFNMCGKKKRFINRLEALHDHPRMKVYRCPYCRLFHVATKNKLKHLPIR